METVDTYFNELNYDILNAKTRKALKVFSRRAKRLYSSLTVNALTSGVKKHVSAQYRYSMNLIKKMSGVVNV